MASPTGSKSSRRESRARLYFDASRIECIWTSYRLPTGVVRQILTALIVRGKLNAESVRQQSIRHCSTSGCGISKACTHLRKSQANNTICATSVCRSREVGAANKWEPKGRFPLHLGVGTTGGSSLHKRIGAIMHIERSQLV